MRYNFFVNRDLFAVENNYYEHRLFAMKKRCSQHRFHLRKFIRIVKENEKQQYEGVITTNAYETSN